MNLFYLLYSEIVMNKVIYYHLLYYDIIMS